MRRRLPAGAGMALLVALAMVVPAAGSDPPSHAVTVPAAGGGSVRVEWTGVIPPGANTSSSCGDATQADEHSIELSVPAGLYDRLAVSARFAIAFDGATDQIVTVVTPDGAEISGDNGFVDADEFVQLLNPAAGTYRVIACGFAAAIPQAYTGSLEMSGTALGECRSDQLAGLDLQTVTIPQLQAALDAGTLTSRRLVEEYLARIAEFDRAGPKLNAVRELNPNALAHADALDAERRATGPRGPMHGIPVMVKDNVGTADMPTTAGSIALEGSVPLRDSFLIERLRAEGAIVLGKLNLSEFANWVSLNMPSGYSSLGGQVRNPYHFGDPSGSSSGSGVASAMALATVTIGTETSGSIISPAFANGIVGLKTTVGLASRAGIIPLAPTFDTPGPMTRTVTDAAVLLGAMTGVDERDPATSESADRIPANSDYTAFLRAEALQGARIGYSTSDRDALGDEQQALLDAALGKLESLGATLVETDQLSTTRTVGLAEIAAIPNEFKASLNRYLATETVPDLRVKTLTQIIEFNRQHPDKVKYGQELLEASDLTLGNMDEPTAIANRTAAIQAARAVIDVAVLADDLDAIVSPNNVNVNVGAAALYPSLTVPAGYTVDGTQPFGITFLGPAYGEPSLIGYAYAYEQATLHRVRPTEVNRALCVGGAAAVMGVRQAAASRDALPATGIPIPWPGGPGLVGLAVLIAIRLRERDDAA
ncbi:MAG TPA: amidase family protein [Actinomycetota bacterium]